MSEYFLLFRDEYGFKATFTKFNLGRIFLQHTRIAVAFAPWNFLLFSSSKTIKYSKGQMRRLYVYAANECALDMLVEIE